MKKKQLSVRWHSIAGIGFILIFISLLAVRVNLFQQRVNPEKSNVKNSARRALPSREVWMDISYGGSKIGYARRSFVTRDSGYVLSETILMRINTMGTVQSIRVNTEGNLNQNMQIKDFKFNLRSSLFSFNLRGFVDGRRLTLFAGDSGGVEKRYEVALKEKPYLSSVILESAAKAGLQPGQERIFHIFDPATMEQRPVRIIAMADETVQVMGEMHNTRKFAVEFLGTKQYAWIDHEGEVLREEGIMGITLERVTMKRALSGLTEDIGVDLTETASIDPGMILEDPSGLKKMIVKLDGPYKKLSLHGGRQSLSENILTVERERLPKRIHPYDISNDSALEGALESSILIQSDHPFIKEKATEIISSGDATEMKARKLVDWVYNNIDKRPVLSIPNALETLRNRQGDCNEHAMLLAALARAAGIPAKIETGLVYQRRRFYYHAWNVLYLGSWVTADSVFGQFPADVTHIRLAEGVEGQVDLVEVIGRLKISILKIY